MKWLFFLFLSTHVHALRKADVDRVIVGCTQKSVKKNLRLLMENDLNVSPNSRTLVIYRDIFEQDDRQLDFDDSPLLNRKYYTLDLSGEYLARFRFRLSRPLTHELNYKLKSIDEDGHIRTDLTLEYTPRLQPQDKVDLVAEYLPSITYTFEEIFRDQFGRIKPESIVKDYKVISHPVQDQESVVFKELSSGEPSEFEFDSKNFKLCLRGEAL